MNSRTGRDSSRERRLAANPGWTVAAVLGLLCVMGGMTLRTAYAPAPGATCGEGRPVIGAAEPPRLTAAGTDAERPMGRRRSSALQEHERLLARASREADPAGVEGVAGGFPDPWGGSAVAAEREGAASADFAERIERWVASDPAQAAAWALGLADHGARRQGLEHVLGLWSRADPALAAVWVNDQIPEEWRDQLLSTVAQVWAVSDPVSAVRLSETIKEAGPRTEAQVVAALSWLATDEESAAAWAAGLAPGPHRERVWRHLAVAQALSDPRRAAQWALDQLPPGREQDRAVVQILQHWGQLDAPAAAAWVEQFPESPLRTAAVENLARMWARLDEEAVVNYTE